MRCPNCGKELEEGKLLCENCGAEIKVVPEYEIEVENEMKNALEHMAMEFSNDEEKDDDFEEDDEFNHSLSNVIANWILNKKVFLILFCSIALIGCVTIGITAMLNNSKKTFGYQYDRAIECASQNQYDEAIVFLERALALEPDNIEARVLLAKYYDKSDRTQSAIKILNEILNMEDSDVGEEKEEVYDFLILLYEKREEYACIGEILKSCQYQRIISKYNQYAASVPEFNKMEGVYDEVISITLKNDTPGIIYYTLDGTTPTTNSSVYEYPILLESGDYVIKALFVNMYGIASDIISKTYYISLLNPSEPVVSHDSGNYSGPQLIEVFHDDSTKIFYTIDGTEPSEDSYRYTESLEMPYGMSNFAFVSINEKGLKSPIVRRTYMLSTNANFSKELALQVLKNNLIICGDIKDSEGHLTDKLGVNMYSISTIVEIDSVVYYIVTEKYIDTTGREHNTNNMFAIETTTANVYRARKISEGRYIITQFD